VEGVHRFLARSYRLVTGSNVTDAEPSRDQLCLLHATIKRVRLLPCRCQKQYVCCM
jgi:leucyl-tRNA synthetase